MTKRITALLTCLGIASANLFMTGCHSAPRQSKPLDYTIPPAIQGQHSDLADCGGIVAVGVSDSSTVQVAVERAQMKARALIAQTTKQELRALQDSVVGELGEEILPAPYTTMFAAAIQGVTTRSPHSPIVLDVVHETIGYRTTAWALAVHSPELIKELLLQQVGEDAAIRTQLAASKAMRKLDQRIDTFDARKRRKGWQTEIEKLRIPE